MSEAWRRTAVYGAAAVLLVGLAFLTKPRSPSAAEFNDQGEEFYPDFKDPGPITSLEVTDYDEALGRRRDFQVALVKDAWIIPTRFNHPADAKDKLGRAAGSLVGLRKEVVRSANANDHEEFGVVDPIEAKQGAKGQGTRVIVKDGGGKVQADYILGKAVTGKAGYRFVRLPGQKRVYETQLPREISARFADWVETDLLQISRNSLATVRFETYSVDKMSGRKRDLEQLVLQHDATGAWKLEGLKPDEEVQTSAQEEMLNALDDLRIVDVRRKPDELIKALKGEAEGVSNATLEDLIERGFYPGRGDLLANDGEMMVEAKEGIRYVLFFGNILTAADVDQGKGAGKDNRYLMIQVSFDEKLLGDPPAPPKETKEDGSPKSDDDKKKDKDEFERKQRDFQSKLDEGKKKQGELAKRFTDWYYVISADSFKKLRKKRVDLIKPKPAPTPTPMPTATPTPTEPPK